MVRSPDEKAIRAELYERIYHSITHPALVLDPDRNIVSANPAGYPYPKIRDILSN